MAEQNKSELKIIFLTVFLYLVGFGVIIPLLPILSRDLGASSFEIGLLLSIYSLLQFIFSPFWGKLSDKFGRRPILLFCLVGEVFSYLLFAFSRSVEVLIFARGLAGFFGASISTANAAISDVTKPEDRSKGMALIGAAFGLGFIVGPALGGLFAWTGHQISPAPFFASTFTLCIVAVLCLLTLIFAYFRLPETRWRKNGGKKPETAEVVVLPGRWQRMRELMKNPVSGVLVFIFFLASTGMSSMEATLALFVGDRFGWGLKEVSFGFVYIGVLSTLNQGYLVRKLLPRWGEKRTLQTGLVLMTLSFLLIGFSWNLWLLGLAMTILPFGLSMTNPSILGSISLLTPADRQGEVLGTTQSFSALGRIAGPALGGFLYQALDHGAPFWAASGLLALAMTLAWWMRSQLPSHAKV